MKLRAAIRCSPPWSMAVAAMLLIQVSNALSVLVIEHLGATGTAWLRLCFGGVLLLAVTRPKFGSIRRKQLSLLVLLGAATGFMTVCFLQAVERIPLGMAAAIEFLGPLAVAGIMSPKKSALLWPAFAFIGVVLLSEPWHGRIDLAGVAFALIAGACWGSYNLLTQRVGDQFAGVTGLALTIPIAVLCTAPLGLPQVVSSRPTWLLLAAVAGIALITPVVAYGLEMLALRRMNHTAFGTLLAIEPGFAVIMGLLLLRQLPTVMQVLGITLVMLAGIAAQRNHAR